MAEYDVHVYAQIRIKVADVQADSPRAAIDAVNAMADVDREVRRMVDHDLQAGPVVAIEYQGEAIPEGWMVDPKDPAESGYGDGVSFDADAEGDPVLRFDPSAMPNPFQAIMAETGGYELASYRDARGNADAIARTNPVEAAIFTALGSASATAAADAMLAALVGRIETLRAAIADTDGERADPRIPIGVAEELTPHGLFARFLEAEDDSVDDSIEILRASDGAEMADVQICGPSEFMAGAWTNDAQDTRAHGPLYRTAAESAADAVRLLRRYKRL